MADPNIELEEFARLVAQFNEELRTLGYVTDQTARAMALGSTKNAKQLEQAGEKAVDALFDLAGSVTGAARAMAQGEKGAAAFNSSLDQLTSGVISVVTVLGLLVPLGRALKPLGGALSALGINVGKVASGAAVMTAGVAGAALAAKGFTDIMKAANEQADRLYKSYSGLARSGAAASDGLTGVFEDAKRLGIAVTELDGMVQVIAQNATELTLFGGGVAKGRQQLASMGKSLEGSREYFLRLGYDMTEVTGVMADYVQQQRLIGNTTVNSAADLERLSQGAQRYLEQQDALTKLTGMARQEQEKAREQVRSQERFAAQLERLRQQGKTKEAEELEKTYLILHSQNKEAAQGFADIQTGNVQTEAAQKSLMGSQGESLRAAQQVMAGQIGAANAAQRIAAAHGETATRLGTTMGLIGTYNQVHGDLAGDLRLRGLAEKDIVKILAEIEEDQKKLKDQQGKGVDKQLVDQAKLRETQIRANEAMERFVSDVGLPAATAAAQAFADGLIYGKDKLYELFGETPPARSEKTPPPPTPMPAQTSDPVKPRPSDPLKAQIWNSNYASGWNPDGTPKSKSDRPAPAPAPAAPRPPAPAPAAPRPPAPAPAAPRPPAPAPAASRPPAPAPAPIPVSPPGTAAPGLAPQGPGRPPAPVPPPVPPGAAVRRRARDENMKDLAATLRASGMDENMVRATLGNVMKETGGAPGAENLKGYAKTSNERIRKIFPSATKDITDEELDRVKRNEQEFAELIYGAGSKQGSGLGNTEAGDGWKYRGRGYIQITGKANYAAASKDIYGDDRLVKDPDLVMNPDVAAEVSSWFMNKNQSRMAKIMGVDASNVTKDQAALLATSIIAGQAVKPGKGYLGGENLDKVKYYMGSMPQYARGGITKGISIAGEAGPEAVVPLPDGRTIPVTIKLSDAAAMGSGALGKNEYTDMPMNFGMAEARSGTPMLGPDFGLEIGTAVKEIMATGDTDVVAALREVRDQFQEAMAQVVDVMKDKDSDTQQRMLETLQNIAALQGRTADASQKMARLAAN